MKKVKCKKCSKKKKHYAKGLCRSCWQMSKHITFMLAGKQHSVYTNGFTEELKPLVSKIKNKVLEDCIKNPSKYLQDFKKGGR